MEGPSLKSKGTGQKFPEPKGRLREVWRKVRGGKVEGNKVVKGYQV